MFNALLTATTAAAPNASQMGGTVGLLTTFLPLVAVIVVMYFMLIRPQRKKEKETQEMRSNLQVGDEVVTMGGLVGLVVSFKDDTVVIETGPDRHKVRMKRWSIQENLTIHE